MSWLGSGHAGTFSMQAALSPWWWLLTWRQTVGGSHSLCIWGHRSLGLGKVHGCWCVAETVPVVAIFVHLPGLGLFNDGARSGNWDALRGQIIHLYSEHVCCVIWVHDMLIFLTRCGLVTTQCQSGCWLVVHSCSWTASYWWLT